MAVPRTSLRGFLAHAKGALRVAIDSKQKVTFVIGNESADLDSMSSSIMYAYIRSMSPPANTFSPHYIPITNIPASDVQLRPEYLAVLKHADIGPKDLITLDDLPSFSEIQSMLLPENTKWILVDHNTLQGQLGKIYSSRVAGAIDHHDDENSVPKDTGDEPRVIEKSGSCTSLVTNFLRPAWDATSAPSTSPGTARAQENNLSHDAAVTLRWHARVAQLGLASILIDTANLQDMHKTTDDDRKAAEYLEAKIMLDPQLATKFDRVSFYKEINSAKKDIGGLKLRDILRKDYKQWDENGQKIGVSSVVKSLEFLKKKAGDEAKEQSSGEAFLEALEGFAREGGLNTYAIMTTSTSSEGEFQRELLLWAFDKDAVSAAKKFAKSSSDELGLEEWQGCSVVADGSRGNGQWRRVWWQRQVQHSRKRVAPLLREAMA
ncbi:exopolyphosphatase-like protein [Pyrenochaeta sp. MPI-SDFR-AT-0127]|nr:exopolyphosphatase-like protein [Pyrenochaeta sp. MPI-SDFR-AT-0127]